MKPVYRKIVIGRLNVTWSKMMPHNWFIPPISTMNLYSGTRIVSGGTISADTNTPYTARFRGVRCRASGYEAIEPISTIRTPEPNVTIALLTSARSRSASRQALTKLSRYR
jgi:hypothetical protein